MPKRIFTEGSSDQLVMAYPAKLIDEPGFDDKLDVVLEEFRHEIKDGAPVFDYIDQDIGKVLIKFHSPIPLRELTMWFNRIEKAMTDICDDQAAA